MKNGIRVLIFFLLLNGLWTNNLFSQDLTGIWRGHFRSNDSYEKVLTNYDDRYKIEVQIAQSVNLFEAVTYSYKNSEFYGKATATGTINNQSKKVLLKEGKLLEVRFASGIVCLMTCFLQYSKLGNDEYLQGTYYSVNVNDTTSGCGKGSIFLHRVTESDFYKEPFLEKKEKEILSNKKAPEILPKAAPVVVSKPKSTGTPKKLSTGSPVAKNNTPAKKTTPLPDSKKAVTKKSVPAPPVAEKKNTPLIPQQNPNKKDSAFTIKGPDVVSIPVPEVIKSRSNILLKTLTVGHSNIELRLYDDGAIDNDTVSVYYDNKLIVSKVRLTDQAIVVHLHVEPSENPHQLVMVAENLGEIPPNTSLLVVRDGEKRYEERIISTEQKNVVINFLYKKIE